MFIFVSNTFVRIPVNDIEILSQTNNEFVCGVKFTEPFVLKDYYYKAYGITYKHMEIGINWSFEFIISEDHMLMSDFKIKNVRTKVIKPHRVSIRDEQLKLILTEYIQERYSLHEYFDYTPNWKKQCLERSR